MYPSPRDRLTIAGAVYDKGRLRAAGRRRPRPSSEPADTRQTADEQRATKSKSKSEERRANFSWQTAHGRRRHANE
eukprot:scaffold1044_cov120-Isochrysis_galbana.AAC.9